MKQRLMKINFPHKSQEKQQLSTIRNESKFNILFKQAFSQVKRNIAESQQQDLPIIKMKSYQKPLLDLDKIKSLRQLSQKSQKIVSSTMTRHSSLIPISARCKQSLPRKDSVNRILWQKKMSLQMLRSNSGYRNKSTNINVNQAKQLPPHPIHKMRQKTVNQQLMMIDDQVEKKYRISIMPVNLSQRNEKDKFFDTKRRMLQKFKTTLDQEDQQKRFRSVKSNSIKHNKNMSTFKRINWEIVNKEVADQESFIDFVRSMKKLD